MVIQSRLQDERTAYEALQFLTKIFGRTQDFITLHERFTRLRFKPAFDSNRFIADFEQIIHDYEQLGSRFSEEYVTTMVSW